MRVYLSKGDSGQTGEEPPPWDSFIIGVEGLHTNEGVDYSLRKEEFGVVFPDFNPSSIFQRGGGVFAPIQVKSEVSWHQCMVGAYL